MRILVTNDDGIDSTGLHELTRAVSNHGDSTVDQGRCGRRPPRRRIAPIAQHHNLDVILDSARTQQRTARVVIERVGR